MITKQLKEELYGKIHNLIADLTTYSPDPEMVKKVVQNTALHMVDLLIFEREVINEVLQTPGDSPWKDVKEEILKDKALWNQ